MDVLFKNFPSIIEDNEQKYYTTLRGVIESLDVTSSILVTRRSGGVSVRIIPSSTSVVNPLILEINKLNSLFGIKANYSKSIKNSFVINFTIDY